MVEKNIYEKKLLRKQKHVNFVTFDLAVDL